jgi:dCTP deaminase
MVQASGPEPGVMDRRQTTGTGNGEATGLLPSQSLQAAVEAGWVPADAPPADEQVQPASIDLRLGTVAYRVRASFLSGPGATVAAKVDAMTMHRIDLTRGAVLERGCVYIVPLAERLALPEDVGGIANPKSSTGRLDVFARVITDHGAEFDRIPPGYTGPLYAEVSPRTFSVLVRAGSRLVQLRLRRGQPQYCESPPVVGPGGPGDPNNADLGVDRRRALVTKGRAVTVDIRGDPATGLIGYRARRHAGLIDADRVNEYPPEEFWEPVRAGSHGGLILDPNEFYILASKEAVTVPEDQAAEMVAYDTLLGEFRVHYAGFFDPGFGLTETGATGARAVLEVRSHEVPFLIEDGQVVGRLWYERLTARPDRLYGRGIGSSYNRQGLALSKHFRR